MAAPAYCFTTLKIDMDEKPEEITIYCNGKITAESAYMFEREVRDNSFPYRGATALRLSIASCLISQT